MILVEKHIIKNSHPEYQNLMYMLHLSKNLYNAALYDIRQHYFSTGEFKSWMCVDREFIQNNNPDYRALKAFLSKSVMKKVGEYPFL
jgi:putative transposase